MQKVRTALLGVLCVVFCAACLVLLSVTFSLRAEVSTLQRTVDALSDEVERQNAYVQNSISEMGDRLSQDLAEQASLFSSVKAQLSYQDGKLVLTADVLPKEVVAGTTYLLTLEDTDQSVNMISDGKSWQGTLSLEPASEFTPVVVVQSASGARQEALDTLYPDSILAVSGECTWSMDAPQANTDGLLLYVALTPSAGGPVTGPEDVARLSLTVRDDNGTALETVEMTAAPAPSEDTRLWYQADLSNYLEQESCSIHLYATLETSSGLSLADCNESASYSRDKNSSSAGTSSLSFSPQW